MMVWPSVCSSTKPVLYPNAHLRSVGKDVAEQDVDACKQSAESTGAEEGSGKGSRVAQAQQSGLGSVPPVALSEAPSLVRPVAVR